MDKIKRPRLRIFQLGQNLWITYGWHYGRKCLYAEIYVDAPPIYTGVGRKSRCQTRTVFGSRREVFSIIRLAVSRGLEDIHWDVPIIKRLVGEESGDQEADDQEADDQENSLLFDPIDFDEFGGRKNG